MRRSLLLAVALALVLTGCVDGSTGSTEVPLEDGADLGEVEGYEPDADLGLDGATTLTADELEAVTYRAMARAEVLRGLPFEDDLDVEVVSREAFREEEQWVEGEADPFTNEVWRAAFVVDGETDYNDALDRLYGDAVQGYYLNGRIVLVADDPEAVRANRNTLVHELVHGLQDQHFGLARQAETLDETRAEEGVIEGDAEYVAQLYAERCAAEWECLEAPGEAAGELEPRSFNVGLFASMYAPYSEGPPFAEHLHETDGWEAVDAAHEDRPASTEQLLHPERYPDERPVDVALADRSSDNWEPFEDGDGVRTETVGEATLFASLYANGVVDRPLTEGGTDRSPYNYSYPATDGWAGDTLVPYREVGGDRTAHVWRLAWDSAADAEAFRDAYLEVLAERGAEEVAADTYRIDDGGFAGAYRVDLAGDEVTIVGGPDRASLAAIRDGERVDSLERPTADAPALEPGIDGSAAGDAVVRRTG